MQNKDPPKTLLTKTKASASRWLRRSAKRAKRRTAPARQASGVGTPYVLSTMSLKAYKQMAQKQKRHALYIT